MGVKIERVRMGGVVVERKMKGFVGAVLYYVTSVKKYQQI
jgi:ABC-type uncharacterized transport system permease subunit